MVSFNPQRLMVVHAHPDDESLFTGHIIAEALAKGAEVKLVTLTRGERGQSQNPVLRPVSRDPKQMAEYRSNLLGSAIEAFPGLQHQFLGTRSYLETPQESTGLKRISNPDPLYNLTLTGSGVKVVRDELVPVLKNFRPDVVVTLSSKSPNTDHKMAFKAVRAALRSIKASKPPKHWVVVEPGQKYEAQVGSSQTEPQKHKAVSVYQDFVTIKSTTYDYGTGELKFSEPEKLRLVS